MIKFIKSSIEDLTTPALSILEFILIISAIYLVSEAGWVTLIFFVILLTHDKINRYVAEKGEQIEETK